MFKRPLTRTKPRLRTLGFSKLLTFEQEFNKRVKKHVQDARGGKFGKGGDRDKHRDIEERIKRGLRKGRGDEGGPGRKVRKR